MPWNTHIDADIPLIEISYLGLVNRSELVAAFTQSLALAIEHNLNLVLADCTELTIGGHSVADLYFLADELAQCSLMTTLKEAILLPAQIASTDTIQFWATTCYNRGINVQVFDCRDSAMAWLLAS
ncbi:hypothetical protein [Methylovulum psychrotolerans]|uniref:STAS/SEC14 domain-containing protein n=1 Tax=Methylovulum psychrotolerans TaxID=1704499 RepID=A0A1Z4BU70_9GAMM|nr:hypothetical protein [Methylovulum psychrotolerans]ASF44847.1 hypothetical protein CEK71_01520 [Methylovulum psychrotolerans]